MFDIDLENVFDEMLAEMNGDKAREAALKNVEPKIKTAEFAESE